MRAGSATEARRDGLQICADIFSGDIFGRPTNPTKIIELPLPRVSSTLFRNSTRDDRKLVCEWGQNKAPPVFWFNAAKTAFVAPRQEGRSEREGRLQAYSSRPKPSTALKKCWLCGEAGQAHCGRTHAPTHVDTGLWGETNQNEKLLLKAATHHLSFALHTYLQPTTYPPNRGRGNSSRVPHGLTQARTTSGAKLCTNGAPFRSTQGGTYRRGCGGGAGHRRYRAHRDAFCASRHARGPPIRAPASCGSSRNGTAAAAVIRSEHGTNRACRAAGRTTAVGRGRGKERGGGWMMLLGTSLTC